MSIRKTEDIKHDLENANRSLVKARHRVNVARRNLTRHSLWLEKCSLRVARINEELSEAGKQ